jgi:Tfp pilus assembly protein PilV
MVKFFFTAQRGLTLAEVAMAMFFIGVGALSIATVYLQRERAASTTGQHAAAHNLAMELAAVIEKRPSANVRFENAIGVRCSGVLKDAKDQARAINEVACWQARVAAQLPNGAGSIAFDESTVPPNYAITVSWSQPRGGLSSYTVRIGSGTPAPAAAAPQVNAATLSKPDATRAAN